MLAEPKRKTVWSLNPRGKYWSEDKSKFGHKMLESMGWTEGHGLGPKGNGITEHIKVSLNSDNKGLGYKPSADSVWIDKNNDYEDLLAELAVHHTNGTNNTRKVSDLEAVSKKMRSRVHYHKLIKSKNLSQCSEKDLLSIFPKKRLNYTNNNTNNSIESNTSPTLTTNTANDVNNDDKFKTIESSLDMNEYFKSKMNKLKLKMSSTKVNDIDTKTSDQLFTQHNNGLTEEDNSSDDKIDSINETDNTNITVTGETDSQSSDYNRKHKKKKRKRTEDHSDDNNMDNNSNLSVSLENELNVLNDKKCKKRKKSKKNQIECEDNNSETQSESNSIESTVSDDKILAMSPTTRKHKKIHKNIDKYGIRVPLGYNNNSASVSECLKNYHKISAAIVSHKALSATNLMILKGYGFDSV